MTARERCSVQKKVRMRMSIYTFFSTYVAALEVCCQSLRPLTGSFTTAAMLDIVFSLGEDLLIPFIGTDQCFASLR